MVDIAAFMRVEPAIGSGPVASRIGWSASASSGVSGLLAMPTVKAPRRRASRRHVSVNGVVPLRVSKEAELEGLDVPEFGMLAYPED